MPLLKGITKKSFRENLRRLRHDGYPQNVAAAIAYSIVRTSARDQGVRRPSWVKAAAPKPPKKGKRKGAMRSAARRPPKKGKRGGRSALVTPKVTNIRVRRPKKKARRRR